MPSGEKKKRSSRSAQLVVESQPARSWLPFIRPPAEASRTSVPWLGGRLLMLAALLALPVWLLVELRELGRMATEASPGFRIHVADINYPNPPAQDRASFLQDVRRTAGLAEQISLFEENLASRLAEGFRQQAWVEQVRRIEVRPGRGISVQLDYRIPVLEVLLADRPNKEAAWIVDAEGVVLPRQSFRGELPLLLIAAKPPRDIGQPWPEPGIKAAAKVAALLCGEESLNLRVLELTDSDLVCATPAGSRVLWGRAPGEEKEGEAVANVKLERLRDYQRSHGSLDSPEGRYEHDVRPPAQSLHRPLPK